MKPLLLNLGVFVLALVVSVVAFNAAAATPAPTPLTEPARNPLVPPLAVGQSLPPPPGIKGKLPPPLPMGTGGVVMPGPVKVNLGDISWVGGSSGHALLAVNKGRKQVKTGSTLLLDGTAYKVKVSPNGVELLLDGAVVAVIEPGAGK